MRGRGEMRVGVAQRDQVPLAGEKRALHVLVRARLREDFVAQRVDAGAGLRGQAARGAAGRRRRPALDLRGATPARSILLWTTMRGSAAGIARESMHPRRPAAIAVRASTITSARSAPCRRPPRCARCRAFRSGRRSAAAPRCRSIGQRNAVDFDLALDGVARGAGDRRDDRDLVARELVEEARLADVGRPDQHDGEPVAQQRPLPRARRARCASCARIAASLPWASAARRKSMSSSGKSSVASVNMRSSISASVSARISRENAPERLRAAARAAVAVAASMRSATLSACARSSLPFRNARCVNSPGFREPRAELEAPREQRGAAPPDRRARAARARARRCTNAARESGAPAPGRAARRASPRNTAIVAWRGSSARLTMPAITAGTAGARDAHDADAAAPRRRRDRGDRVGRRGHAARLPHGAAGNQRRFAAAAAASFSSRRFMCHCWKIWMQLLTSQ